MSADSRTWFRVGLGLFIVAYGANILAPLLPAYRLATELSQPQVTFLLAVYVMGLIPALLIGGPLSDMHGRRALTRPALVFSGLGSAILTFGASGSFLALATGRLIVGSSVGLVMAAGTAWLQELSPGPEHVGARRATIALSLGFGGGTVLAGFIGEFLPYPVLLPYLLHILLLAVIAPYVWRAPGGADRHAGLRRALFSRSVLSRRFVFAVAAWAPWGFGAVSTTMAVLPALVDDQISRPVAFTGIIVAVMMSTGVFVQPLATRLGSDLVPPATLGLCLVVSGMLTSAVVIVAERPWLIFPAAVLNGAAYGVMMVSGLREVRLIAPTEELGAATAVFYSLTYLGLFAPLALSLLGPLVGYSTLFIGGAAIAAASVVPVLHIARRTSRGE